MWSVFAIVTLYKWTFRFRRLHMDPQLSLPNSVWFQPHLAASPSFWNQGEQFEKSWADQRQTDKCAEIPAEHLQLMVFQHFISLSFQFVHLIWCSRSNKANPAVKNTYITSAVITKVPWSPPDRHPKNKWNGLFPDVHLQGVSTFMSDLACGILDFIAFLISWFGTLLRKIRDKTPQNWRLI